MKKEDCIFCKIANGQIPSKTIYEDEEFRVILDLGPATKGHALILPKEHLLLAKEMAGRMAEKLHCDGLNLVQNNGEAAGQTVLHFHLHLIPRYLNDGLDMKWTHGEPSQEELEAICELLTKE